ncbi:Hypothetical predicted protein [Lecanosticta acicola]|uniref:SCP domain-containing protein n=1 Tax=Lecanosticta acicola TaxID=111012 RepID=A0AAI9EA78_9PEZI|nr:Hypothetical predicted protein [Lecanosticta acicola]
MPHFFDKLKEKVHPTHGREEHKTTTTEKHTETTKTDANAPDSSDKHTETTTTTTTNQNDAPAVPVQRSVDATAGSLDLHNKARSAHGSQALAWDDQLARDAAHYAQKLADKDKMEHSNAAGQGENLFMATNDASFEDAVNAWLKEEASYGGEKIGEGNLGDWGHYTQCVWKDTTKVGIGKAKTKTGGTYIVARYTPPGNMMGDKPY